MPKFPLYRINQRWWLQLFYPTSTGYNSDFSAISCNYFSFDIWMWQWYAFIMRFICKVLVCVCAKVTWWEKNGNKNKTESKSCTRKRHTLIAIYEEIQIFTERETHSYREKNYKGFFLLHVYLIRVLTIRVCL